jgi:hypothetical protein
MNLIHWLKIHLRGNFGLELDDLGTHKSLKMRQPQGLALESRRSKRNVQLESRDGWILKRLLFLFIL